MKKIYYLIILLLVTMTLPAQAANYELKELIPVDTTTTIVTKHFSYQDFFYNTDTKSIYFKNIKNISNDQLPLSISIGLFDKNKKNIGTINYCSTEDIELKVDEEEEFDLPVAKYLTENKSLEDIHYIAVLHDNINCTTEGKDDFVGKTVEHMGELEITTLDEKAGYLITIICIIAGILLFLFLYKFLFTNAYTNFDGEDVRRDYKKLNKKLKEEREKNPPKVEEKVINTKSEEIRQQEEYEGKKETKEGTDLHNLYK